MKDKDARAPFRLMVADVRTGTVTEALGPATRAVAPRTFASDARTPQFSADGKRLALWTATLPAPRPPSAPAARFTQLGDDAVPEVTLAGDARYALGVTSVPYAKLATWDDSYYDVYRIDVATGARTLLQRRVRGNPPALSPGGRYALAYDEVRRAWYTLRLADGRKAWLTTRAACGRPTKKTIIPPRRRRTAPPAGRPAIAPSCSTTATTCGRRSPTAARRSTSRPARDAARGGSSAPSARARASPTTSSSPAGRCTNARRTCSRWWTTPPGFDRHRRYPMLVYVYEKMSDDLHGYVVPASGTVVNLARYANHGYVVLQPDIRYRIGHTTASAVDCVTAAVRTVVAMGFVDPQRIGMAGHSYGGYEVNALVTRASSSSPRCGARARRRTCSPSSGRTTAWRNSRTKTTGPCTSTNSSITFCSARRRPSG